MPPSYFALKIHGLECDWVIGDDGNRVPDVLRAFLLEESDAASVLATKHRLDGELELFLATRRNGQFLHALTVQ